MFHAKVRTALNRINSRCSPTTGLVFHESDKYLDLLSSSTHLRKRTLHSGVDTHPLDFYYQDVVSSVSHEVITFTMYVSPTALRSGGLST